jgi:membrane associated rhomboid family serine protease
MENNFGANNIIIDNNDNNLNNNSDQDNIPNNNVPNNNKAITNFFKKYPSITISFLIFLIINTIIYLYSKFIPLQTHKYIFQYIPIVKKFQLYRIITRYFIHFGIVHLILELIALFYLCKFLENSFGTLFTLSIIFISMILDSSIQLIIIPVFSFFLKGRIALLYNFFYEGGLTPIVFTLLTYFYLYRRNSHRQFNFESLLILRAKYSYIYLLVLLYCFTPNRTFYGNVSGIIGGHLLKKYGNYVLPKIKWIKDLEDNYSLNKIKILYRCIDISNKKMKDILDEYDRDSIEEISLIYENNEKDNKTNNDGLSVEDNNDINP